MENKGVQTLERALDIIELLSLEREGLGVTEIGNRLDLHKSTVHRLLSSLGERGYIEKDGDRASYRLGLKFVEIGSLRLNHLELKTEAAPYLRRLAEQCNQPVHLAILDGTEAVYIEKIEPVANLRMYSQIGKRIPVYCAALGKSLLLGKSDTEITSIMSAASYQRFTASTKLGIEALLHEIAIGRKRGWTLDDAEHEDGIRCVAAPVRDYKGTIIAAVSVSGDMKIISPGKDEIHSGLVLDCAAAISRRMGYVAI